MYCGKAFGTTDTTLHGSEISFRCISLNVHLMENRSKR